jgi:predicted nuclease with RNAse H fold
LNKLHVGADGPSPPWFFRVEVHLRTLGIDLASQPVKTGACVLDWSAGSVRVVEVGVGYDDDALIHLADRCDAIGIDAPFGWPSPFSALVAQWTAGTPQDSAPWTPERRDELRFRATDVAVAQRLGRMPLSVSSDLIAIPTWRCMGLLTRLGVEDRSGDGRVFEVYPAAALAAWGLRSRGYKRAKGLPALAELSAALLEQIPTLEVDEDQGHAIRAVDDAFDALVCGLVARAAARGLTPAPPSPLQRTATCEGWIAVPSAPLSELLE